MLFIDSNFQRIIQLATFYQIMQEKPQDNEDLDSQRGHVLDKSNRNNDDEGSISDREDDIVDDDDNDKKKGVDNDNSNKFRRNQVMGRKDRINDGVGSNTEGIFLYKPGVELPNLFPFLQQHVKMW